MNSNRNHQKKIIKNFLSHVSINQQNILKIQIIHASGLSAQLSYYFMLSLFPMLLFLLSIVPYLGIKQGSIRSMIKEHVPQDYAPQVSSIIGDIMDNASGGLLSIGLIAALWSASNGMTALMNSFNVAYDVEDSRNFVVSKLYSVLF